MSFIFKETLNFKFQSYKTEGRRNWNYLQYLVVVNGITTHQLYLSDKVNKFQSQRLKFWSEEDLIHTHRLKYRVMRLQSAEQLLLTTVT